MTLRKTTIIVPQSRVYSSRPRLRQRHFSARVKAIRSSTTDGKDGPHLRRQQTLTQLDFPAVSSSRSSFESENHDSTEEEWEAPRSRKRRRLDQAEDEAEAQRQKTLTQMHGFLQRGDHSSDTEEDMSEGEQGQASDMEVGGEGLRGEEGQENAWHASFRNDKSEDQPSQGSKDPPKSSPQLAMSDHTTSPLSSHKPPSTPMRSQKREIPSSQSPTPSPLSTQQETPTKSKRTPLQEIHPNILAMRDSVSPAKRPKYVDKLIIKDSLSDESDLAGDENSDPDDAVGPSARSQPKIAEHTANYSRRTSAASAYTLSAPQTPPNHDETIRTSQASTLSMSPSPFKRPALPAHAVSCTRAGSHSSPQDPDSPFKRPALPFNSPGRHSPHSPALSSPHSSASPSPSPSPSKTDRTPESPSTLHPPSFPASISQWSFNMSIDSQFTVDDDCAEGSGERAPMLASINDSADIVMASQLCPRSSLE